MNSPAPGEERLADGSVVIPAARATGIGSDIQRPLARVVVGGLLFTLLWTLLVLGRTHNAAAQ